MSGSDSNSSSVPGATAISALKPGSDSDSSSIAEADTAGVLVSDPEGSSSSAADADALSALKSESDSVSSSHEQVATSRTWTEQDFSNYPDPDTFLEAGNEASDESSSN